jgi:hypothetical protein
MGAILILAPAIIAGWPAITAAVAGTAAVLGMNMAKEVHKIVKQPEKVDKITSVELDMDKSEVLESGLTGNEEIVLRKADMSVRIHRDEYGRLRFHVDGKNRSKTELEEFGRQIVEKVTQTYMYNRVVTELKQRGIEVQHEEVTEDNTVHIYVRNILE